MFAGLKLYSEPTAGADHSMPMAFSFSANWKSNQTVTGVTPATGRYQAIPHGLTFSGVTLDGTLMGWQGNVRDTMFENITSQRYSDLQDGKGANVGGIGKWFPPPHLFDLNYNAAGDSMLFNTNIHFDGILDAGPRLGVAQDKGGNDSVSGYALSLKLGCTECSVDHYGSTRPDGFMDVLPSRNMTVSNVFAAFDSSFINNAFPGGMRFPATGYTAVEFQNIKLMDVAASSITGAIGNAASATNVGIVFDNVQVVLNRWDGSNLPIPTVGGRTNAIDLDIDMPGQSAHVSYLLNGTVSTTLRVNPATVNADASTLLSWKSAGAAACSAGGGWSGSVGTSGSRAIKVAAPSADFSLTCRSSSLSSSAALRVLTK